MKLHNPIVVTRFPNHVQHLIEIGLVPVGVEVVERATVDNVRDRNVVAILPMHIACHARSVTEVSLAVPEHLKGGALTIEETRQYARKPKTYIVNQVDDCLLTRHLKMGSVFGGDE